ncbi:MAG: beta-galactosidase, partial [Acidimicrobiales bacterium]
WACWGWVEPEPGTYCFEDYDELVALGEQAGLKVVISTVAEIHPFWIHRVVPGSAMVDHMGHTVVSSLRRECNIGLTPGGCTDNPEVKERMGSFLSTIAQRYRSATNLVAWDCWNETRWAVQADGYVCYCDHTLREYRSYLDKRYGGLDGLNEAWKRRYRSWEDVRPGKSPDRPYTDLVVFEAFLTARAGEHAAFRWQVIHAADPNHPVVAHCGAPSVFSTGRDYEQALARGNDWDLADALDGFGSSHFPIWSGISDVDLGARIEAVRSAVRSKPMWVSELQGGGARNSIEVDEAVPASAQQRWVWNAIGRGAKAVIFWCWRDEVFGPESSGFGLSGSDGQAGERLAALKVTGDVLERHSDLIDAYLPDPVKVGVLFEESNYHLDWAQYGASCEQAGQSVLGYLRALERAQVPYQVVDSGHMEGLDGLGLLIMPWPLVVAPAAAERIAAWVEGGGALLVESELGAYDEQGFYFYPAERALATRLGIRSSGRRVIGPPRVVVRAEGGPYHLAAASWVEAFDPGDATVIANVGEEAVATTSKRGDGTVISVGTFLGLAYSREPNPEFEHFVEAVVGSAATAPKLVSSAPDGEHLQWRLGTAGSQRLLFVTTDAGPVEVTFHSPLDIFGPGDELVDLIEGTRANVQSSTDCNLVTLNMPSHGVAVWTWEPHAGS